ncbi:unnamed protein product [Malus baccata var. baccata]
MKKPVHPNDQSLFAQVVAKSKSDATRILDKPDHEGKGKFSVNGKDVKAKRYKPCQNKQGRNQSQDSNGSSSHPTKQPGTARQDRAIAHKICPVQRAIL